jgi:catechol 2,3-dioxygenase-like lactoylglutathione lyase family enzyme
MIVGIHHFAVNVKDFDRMLKFYREAFGFLPCRDEFAWADEPRIDQIIDVPDSAARSIMLKAGNVYIELFEYSRPLVETDKRQRPFDKGYTHLCIESNDIAKDLEHLKACGMTFSGRDFIDMNDVKTIYGYDPDGNILEIQNCSADSPQRLGLLTERADA